MNINRYSAKVNGIRLHYAIAGEGDPVLLWHGFPGTSRSWRKVVPLLARNHTVIVPDMRGFGDSAKPESGYDAHSLVGDFRELLSQIGVGPIHLVAHDMGAPRSCGPAITLTRFAHWPISTSPSSPVNRSKG